MQKPPAALIVGPTGVGKTAASVGIAKALGTEIISADSMQVYTHMNIGTAKVTAAETEGVIHHMTDVVSPLVNYSVCDYVNAARRVMDGMYKRGLVPLIVGGTGLYADALTGKFSFEENASSDKACREELFAAAERDGAQRVHDMLREVDSTSADLIHPNNVKRVVRALEYFYATGKPISSHNELTKKAPLPYRISKLGFTRSRENLYDRINRRVDKMLADGLVDEVKCLLDMGCTRENTCMQALGYKEAADYLGGKIGYDEMTELIKRNTRRYAKRQLTWFRRDSDIHWINLDDFSDPGALTKMCAGLICEDLELDLRSEL